MKVIHERAKSCAMDFGTGNSTEMRRPFYGGLMARRAPFNRMRYGFLRPAMTVRSNAESFNPLTGTILGRY